LIQQLTGEEETLVKNLGQILNRNSIFLLFHSTYQKKLIHKFLDASNFKQVSHKKSIMQLSQLYSTHYKQQQLSSHAYFLACKFNVKAVSH